MNHSEESLIHSIKIEPIDSKKSNEQIKSKKKKALHQVFIVLLVLKIVSLLYVGFTYYNNRK